MTNKNKLNEWCKDPKNIESITQSIKRSAEVIKRV